MMARTRTAWWVGMMLTAMCASAQTPQTGTVPQSTPATPTSPSQGPATSTTTQGPSGTIEMKSSPQPPEKNKLAPENGGLTFLPELKPADGVVNLAEQPGGNAQVASESAAMHEKPMLLDRAVAVINGKVILASDVHEQQRYAVFEPLSARGGELTAMQAMQQIVNRTLLLDQMQEQELAPPPTVREVNEEIADLRKHIPACAGQGCETEQGWESFLKGRGLTDAELRTHWKQRMAILDFIRVRFQTGIRITKPEIETYYKEQLVPVFEARKLKPPPLAQVSERIEEVLLQQHVNVLLEDYLRSLKDVGSVLILDPQYNSLGSPAPPGTSPGGGDVTPPSPHAPTGGEQ
jgi:peptidyl-prolyl cis-trans isomerase SurA